MGYTGTTRLVTLSIGVVWTAVMLRFMGPSAYVLLSDWLPRAYVSISSWLTPPYLYLIINGIILSIAASSRFSPPKTLPVKDSIPVPVPGADPVQVPVPIPVSVALQDRVPVQVPPAPLEVPTSVPVPVQREDRKPIFEIPDVEDEEEEFVIRGPRWDMEKREDEEMAPVVYTDSLVEPVVRADSMEMPIEYTKLTESTEKPPVSSRFSRKSVRPSPEGKALRVARSRKGETLESTWRAITEGRQLPLARHLKKSDTWETRAPQKISDEVAPPPGPLMRKAETFHERGGGDSPLAGSGEKKIKREPSLGQDELNRRVEAFIKKFNEEMRLQRQESFKHYMDMVNQGVDQ
ncbi:hypothetical protein LUZ61_008792 [Rhynchospora tenuis]|uniref:DUF4408 domain-containing protein n=1 Tax=Rhynchospora tenuis TaxID=198213 RepID=A0AAD6EXS4_9POAL|nr:hypothetical protein LUZ61_008792 [Rhynchospora tenuis]